MGHPDRIKLPNGKVINRSTDPLREQLSQPADKDQQQQGQKPPDSDGHYHQSFELGGRKPGILMIGAGAVGSHLAFSLASACDCNFLLVDYDKVDIKHTRRARTIYSQDQAGKDKVYAARDTIEKTFPDSQVHPFPFNVMDLQDAALINLASHSQIVINAIDDPEAMLKINDLLYSLTEIVFVALHTRADTGHIIVTIPWATACIRCCLDIDEPDQIQTLHSEPALSLDIKNITNYCASIALEIIKSKLTGNPIERWDITRNIFYFVNKRQEISPDGPGIYMHTGKKRKNCPVCNISGSNG